MSRRERMMVFGLTGALTVLILALFGYLIFEGLDTRRSKNTRLRDLLQRLEKNRARLVAGLNQDARLDIKLDRKPPALQAHLDGLAKRHEVEVKDYKPMTPKELGKQKRVLEKAVTISIYNIELDKFMKFITAVETSGYLIMTTQMQVVPRSSDHGKLDIKKLKISSYERNPGGGSTSSTNGKKRKNKVKVKH